MDGDEATYPHAWADLQALNYAIMSISIPFHRHIYVGALTSLTNMSRKIAYVDMTLLAQVILSHARPPGIRLPTAPRDSSGC
ncbi:hypothetical protein SAMN04488061_3445 [Filomicrobium insigne]|uniref:Uncharacterized protein n=1 Tax=Filomicrobium insigne TaxID=418854 RepID=A0A1H0TZI8_9HYPH|nr:hypothetical protein SAMN04488061_3445 [Filomicrobium insigne]